ncbi:hypothetical protein FRC03_006771 [Tulasnella sp. 419]|nr:hypothetical protein FRC03_006771 [Tulasnella sp. 419]
MTRVTNLGRKRTYHEAGFNNTFKDEKQEENTVETPSPSKKQKRKKDKDAHSRKETSEKRRLKRIAERHADTICFACRERGHSSKECPTAPQSDRIEQLEAKGIHGRAVGGICYRCGSTRHRLNRCKKPENPNDPLPFAACFVCSGTGHLASKCPQNEGKGIYPKGGACKLCGETSHLAKDCPLRQDGKLASTYAAWLVLFTLKLPQSH